MRKLSLLILIASYSCEFYDGRLTVVNESGKSICVQAIDGEFPTRLSFNQMEYYLEAGIGSATERKLIQNGRNGWEESIRRNRNGKLNLITFSLDTLQKYKDLDYLFDHNLYTLHSYTIDELNDSEWIVRVKN